MGKIWVEICLISARGLTRTSSLWKLQWFAVGWIDPNNKYCTKIDASGNANPIWKTKFSALIDNSDSRFNDLALNVEVYSRDPMFLKERLQGTASVGLKEFLDKHRNHPDASRHVEEVGSFQLRKRNSSKPQGFVDVSIRISEETDEGCSYVGDDAGIKLRIRNDGINLPSPGPSHHQLATPMPPSYDSASAGGPSHRPLPGHSSALGPSYHQPRAPMPPSYASAGGPSHQPLHVHSSAPGPSYHQPPTPPPGPPPQPPYNVGYMPTFLPKTDNLPPSYINMPSSSGAAAPGPRTGPGFAMGLGAGALAAGAVIFGDDFMSGFDLPTNFTISADPPF